MEEQEQGEIEITASADAETVCVNRARTLIGRFTPIDLEVWDGDVRCFDEGETTRSDWQYFVERMKAVHGVDVHEKWMPPRLKC